MAVTRAISSSTQYSNGATITSSYTLTGVEENNLSALVPASATTQYEFAFTYTNLLAFSAIAQAAGLTLKWNSSGSPVSPMLLAAGVAASWDSQEYLINNTIWQNPFSANVTTLYVTNSSTSAVQLDISALLSG